LKKKSLPLGKKMSLGFVKPNVHPRQTTNVDFRENVKQKLDDHQHK
tara:strand:- start:252 stop:389 length:138 start_codon:yes stop_codon:yes gene_type:complete